MIGFTTRLFLLFPAHAGVIRFPTYKSICGEPVPRTRGGDYDESNVQ